MKLNVTVAGLVVLGAGAFWVLNPLAIAAKDMSRPDVVQPEGTEVATFAGGCFWCVEADMEKIKGVKAAISGFAGGSRSNPAYNAVAYGKTDHLETVHLFYDPKQVSYAELVDHFFRLIDPTDAEGSFVDRGAHYRSAIFVHNNAQRRIAKAAIAKIEALGLFEKPVVTEVRDFKNFFPAENYHQDFSKKSSARYTSYRRGSGRDAFIERVWKDVPPLVKKGAES